MKIALIDPKIPQNTGNIARLCASTNTALDLVGELGFSLEDKYLKRAGLDYWSEVQMEVHGDVDAYFHALEKSAKEAIEYPSQFYLLTTKTAQPYWDVTFGSNDTLIFGSETKGLDAKYRERYPERCITIPMENPHVRSLNLATSAGIVLLEALRQNAKK